MSSRSVSVPSACSAGPLAYGVNRRRWIERSMHQTCSFKRINGTAYPESIASILRDAFGGELRSTVGAAREGSLGDLPLAPKAIGVAQGLTSRGQSNNSVGSLSLHGWCFGLAQRTPSLYGATEGSASEAADVETKRFGLSTAPDVRLSSVEASAAAESAFPEGAIASILRDASGEKRASESMLAYA